MTLSAYTDRPSDADRLRAIALLIEPLTCTPDDNSLTATSIQRIATGEESPEQAIGALGDDWADTLAEYSTQTALDRLASGEE